MGQTLAPQQQIAHYRVLEKLGEGGPPPLRLKRVELRRGLAEAQPGRTR